MSSSRFSILLVLVVAVVATVTVAPHTADAFVSPKASITTRTLTAGRTLVAAPVTVTSLNAFGKKKKEAEDLSFIETRDMTREEMLELNKQNEDIMNTELAAMTGFSLVLTLPILYLCWVAFFSD